jgi:formiminotetrahydrofolate cyclodeaminase
VSAPYPGGPNGLEAVQALATLASTETAAAAGSAAALCGAAAAAVVVKASRTSGRHGEAAQAALLRDRLMRLAGVDAAVLAVARAALAAAGAQGEGSAEQRDFQLGCVLRRASAAPREIAETCADVALLAGGEAEAVNDDLRPDAVASAHLAAGAAGAAAHLVSINLVLTEGDEELVRARAAAAAAAEVVDAFRAA